ncbi:hypothetical protein AQZ52_10785 [Novosphingobium fuchskuhlense]|uniref:Uncharacterized protein n=1 Tax=Novosphingobium fuchskuhlense TaxID=1117702 RepID=A0A124JUF1_9SPHN|nr:hypothetical protein AQZ52_10785 [Novosphingobium fuchskuhlense]
MLDRVSGAVGRKVGRSVCRTLGLHAPGPVIKSNGLFFYGRCKFCARIITRTGPASWRAARAVDEVYLGEMRDVST